MRPVGKWMYNETVIYSVSGALEFKGDHFAVVRTGGIGIKLLVGERTLRMLPAAPAGSSAPAGRPAAAPPGPAVFLYSYMHVRENAIELYGFLDENERSYFEMLLSVSGVGPKSALAILDVAPLQELSAAIKEGRPDLLTRAAGIGRKTAERVIIELRTKVTSASAGLVVEKMEADADLIEALSNLGYRREDARAALAKVDPDIRGIEARLKAALALLGKQ